MLANKGTFRDLMTQDRQFRVPLYQRHYKWNRQQQNQLWLDVIDQYKAIGAAESTTPSHFIGSIVAVALEPDPLKDFREFRVVDGQQRILTLSIAFAALRDVAALDDETQRERFNSKYLVNSTEEQGSGLWARLVPGEEDAGAYWTVLTNPSEADGHTAVGAAYRFFRSEVKSIRDGDGLEIDQLANALGSRLTLVFVTVEEDERPHKIFESINATGVALTEADLLRNYLFMALGARTDSVYQEYWRPMEKLLGDSVEDLVRDDLQVNGTFIKRDQVYRTHRARLEPEAHDLDFLEGRVRELNRRGQYYRAFLRPDDDDIAERLKLTDSERSHLQFLRSWGATTAYPFLLHLYGRVDDGSATHEQVGNCLAYLESFLVRRHLAAISTRVLNRLFLGLIGALPGSDPVDQALHRELSRDGRWPGDDVVREGVRAVPFYQHGRNHQQKLVLERLETHLRSEIAVDFDASALTIEHVLPQTMSADWRTRLQQEGADPDALFALHGHALGNLTLTAFNSELSNNLIERKQEILSQSELRLNEPIAHVEKWGLEEIEDRAAWIADTAVDCWMAPIPGVVTPYAGFDWSRIDQAVEAIPMGRWTSYGDLAELGGTAAQPTASHVAASDGPKHAYRVLGGDGSVSQHFAWTDPGDDRDPIEVLTGEGIEFDDDGKASQTQRLTPTELAELAGDTGDEV